MERMFVRTVFGFDREYVVSGCGRVFSLQRKGAWLSRELVPQINHNGYEKVTLTKEGKRKYAFVHRIVAENFIENDLDKKTVNHKDGNKRNNTVENLEWATHSENRQHAIDNNLGKIAKGSDMSKVLKEEDVLEIVSLRKKGMKYKDIAMLFNRPKSTIQSILNGRRWNHLTNIKPL